MAPPAHSPGLIAGFKWAGKHRGGSKAGVPRLAAAGFYELIADIYRRAQVIRAAARQ
jgi:hypothetical protein